VDVLCVIRTGQSHQLRDGHNINSEVCMLLLSSVQHCTTTRPQQILVLGRLTLFAVPTVERSTSFSARAHKLVYLCETNIEAEFFVRNTGLNYSDNRGVQWNQ
jgi:hypothetical protein